MAQTGTERSWSVAQSAELYGLERWGHRISRLMPEGMLRSNRAVIAAVRLT